MKLHAAHYPGGTNCMADGIQLSFNDDTNRIYDGVEAETRKSQASFQII